MLDHLLVQTLVLIAASFAAVAAAVRLRLSPILGYLAAGLLIGPSGFGAVQESAGLRFLAELGVALLMFFVGLEFSLARLAAARHLVLGAGALQVAGTAALGAGGAVLAGGGWPAAVAIGAALAMSSTAIVHKQLLERHAVTSTHGTAALAILLFQDLVALPMLVLIGALDPRSGDAGALIVVTRIVASGFAFALVAFAARRTIGRLLAWTAGFRSNEPFLLAALALIVGSAGLAEAIGLSLPIGAFVVGAIVAETDFRHHLEDEIRPFRDLLLGLFFLTIGMSVDWAAAARAPALAVATLALLLVLKAGVSTLAVRALGIERGAALRAGVLLAHGGEFALLLLSQALATRLVAPALGQPVLAAVALSMLVAPAWTAAAELAIRRWARRTLAVSALAERRDLADHVIIAGGGATGRSLAAALDTAAVPHILIERDPETFRRARAAGHRVLFGNALRLRLLEAAGLESARCLVALFKRSERVEALIRTVRKARPELPVIVGTLDERTDAAIRQGGANETVSLPAAAARALALEVLIALGATRDEAEDRLGSGSRQEGLGAAE